MRGMPIKLDVGRTPAGVPPNALTGSVAIEIPSAVTRCRNRKRSDLQLLWRTCDVQRFRRLRPLGLARPESHELDPEQQADRQSA